MKQGKQPKGGEIHNNERKVEIFVRGSWGGEEGKTSTGQELGLGGC